MNYFEEGTTPMDYCDEESETGVTQESEDTSGEDSEPLRVREMIKLYNFATEQNQELKHVKSMYLASGKPMAPILADGESYYSVSGSLSAEEQIKEMEIEPNKENDDVAAATFCMTTKEDRTYLRQCLLCNSENKHSMPIGALEKSYTSSTTIRRIENGVRIVIDIFCESDDNTIDLMGSVVQTTIPSSRILTEFHNESMGLGIEKKPKPKQF
ncbi:uncharacterized protein LOC108157719 [Drosophila miranda]|uniref:uncharacterized protein LOC108157719 n=1 Tax=Drosophila miranda TaxID=7229 RepID=UPI0007E64097|nr:uncharacterized protein LOC108157719 [Drosophila miranda]